MILTDGLNKCTILLTLMPNICKITLKPLLGCESQNHDTIFNTDSIVVKTYLVLPNT